MLTAEFRQCRNISELYVRFSRTETENIRRLLKSRERLVRSIVGQKNEVHALLVSMGLKDEQRSLQKQEEAVLRFWEDYDVYKKSVAQREGADEYVFFDGPPFATGLPHIVL